MLLRAHLDRQTRWLVGASFRAIPNAATLTVMIIPRRSSSKVPPGAGRRIEPLVMIVRPRAIDAYL